uniref:ATP-binding cassette sub-family C member 5 n=1 Tax=Crassostrea virginica TaxID=6565 RepID=A0A8B8A600_CRAVI|nr:multidrug resistance-associated protein 5-like isoform X2 [Crassostrea virginica]
MSKADDPLISEEDPVGNQRLDAEDLEEEEEDVEELVDLECQATSGLDLRYSRRKGKYKSAMKSLIPVRFKKAPKDELPEASAGFFSLLTYAWLTPIMWKINRKGTDFLQHMRCPDVNRAEINAERLDRIWKEEVKAKGAEDASFARTLWRAGRTRVLLGGLTFIISMSFSFAAPAFVLRKILDDLSTGNSNIGLGISLVVLMAAMEFCRSMFFALGWVTNYTTGLRMRGAVLSMLYSKILRLRGLKEKTVGELVNICSNDGQRLYDAFAIGPLLIGGPVILFYGIIYTAFLIGPWAFVGSATYLSFYPFMAFISKITAHFRRKGIVITDKRVRMMAELFNCIKLIKMYAWEKSFARTIAGIRSQERKVLEKSAYTNSVSTSVAPMVPIMASVFVITAHVMTGNPLSATQAFVLVSVNNKLKAVLKQMTQLVKQLAEVKVCSERVKSLLMMEEIQPHMSQINNPKYAVVIKKASFAWDQEMAIQNIGLMDIQITVSNGTAGGKDEEKEKLNKSSEEKESLAPPVLLDIDLVLEKGRLLGVCGSVGAGKSSLISAILGRMIKTSGKVAVSGSIAYVSQQPWILNATIRENILFGEMYNEDRYNAAIDACCLREDLETFVSGDETEIGERGINMSGGQKQRLALARALYADKDIYLMDDPLSAVDIHVGRHIFTECLINSLKNKPNKTILFVTHQLQYLSSCDEIIVIKDGMIAERGKHQALMEQNGEYSSLINRFYTQEDVEETTDDPISPVSLKEKPMFNDTNSNNNRKRTASVLSRESELSQSPGSQTGVLDPGKGHHKGLETQMSVNSITQEEKTNKGRLIVAEETSKGKVTFRTYGVYMKAAGGFIISGLVLLVYVISIGVGTGTSWWLSYWLQQGGGNTTIDLGNNVTVISRDIRDNPDLEFYALIYGMGIIAMVVFTLLRAFLFMKVTLHASSKLHDRNFQKILGCPMSFFDSTPIGRIVNRFAYDMDEIDVRLPGNAEIFLMNILMIIFSLISIVYVSPYFLIALVPLAIMFFVLNLVFTSSVRELKRMDAKTRSPLISHITATVQGISTIHAFGKSTEFMDRFHQLLDTNSLPFFLFSASNRWLAVRLDLLCVIVVAVTGFLAILTNIPPALAGMALAFSVQMTGLFQFTVRMAIETEARFTSVERLSQYEKEAETEGSNKTNPPPADWPQEGTLVFKGVKLRYRQNLPLALKGVSFDVLPQEKIGIVGRSGSGKSSLGVALFRLVELDSGTIKLDGIDISTLGLQDLRSKLSIIPQDPVLFIGTIRYNLDPFGEYNDEALWSALEKCHIKETIASMESQLDSQVIENGENFSVGERQLMCLARALLRHSKILMLDEATAAIDTETDALVQTTIKEAFADCTMLIIAHRLNTVLSCNRILVMEEGKVVEFDTPGKLMANSKSKFKLMLEATENHTS